MDWLGSSREEREARWKPSRLYSDEDNDFRRKDYSLHCEFGGHPTPDGTLAAGQILTPEQDATQTANGYTHLLQHLHSIFEFAVACADGLDEIHNRPRTVPEDARNEYAEAVTLHLKTDKFGPATAHFSSVALTLGMRRGATRLRSQRVSCFVSRRRIEPSKRRAVVGPSCGNPGPDRTRLAWLSTSD
ncbi:MAG: hypothetical protein DI635_15325 [Pseudoxanthomonas suwonensis]|nr:MAG: hypothetical protein DI635_15325 [Pseudoxanthomonas suwonensis]